MDEKTKKKLNKKVNKLLTFLEEEHISDLQLENRQSDISKRYFDIKITSSKHPKNACVMCHKEVTPINNPHYFVDGRPICKDCFYKSCCEGAL